jgi:vacuolar-type H+-ATPase subunit F/Vma7
MASRIVFIGDELAAAGFRLAGLSVRVPDPGAETELLHEELARAVLILIAGRAAARIREPELRRALLSDRPLTLVLPDMPAGASGTDVAKSVRLQLGLEDT